MADFDSDWMSKAACSEHEDLFFPEGRTQLNLRLLRRICGGCPVRVSCESYGRRLLKTTLPISHGMWGGYTVPELIRTSWKTKTDRRSA